MHPSCVLDHSLQMIGQRYGVATRQWVATQLEYEEEYEDPVVRCGAAGPSP